MVKYRIEASKMQALNQAYFYDRLYFSLKEEGISFNYGDFVSRILKNGTIKVLKSLGLYKVEGARRNKTVYIHEKVKLIINTTIADSSVVSNTIVELSKGHYVNIPRLAVSSYVEFNKLDSDYPCSIESSKCTYIIFNPENNLHKIGRASDVFARLKTLRNEISPKLDIYGYINKDIEGVLHKEYSEKREYGEWFSLCNNDILDIKNKYGLIVIQLSL